MVLFLKMFRKFRHENRELLLAAWFFFVAFLIFNFVMITTEHLDPLTAFYFSFVTATTVGYGDVSPATPVGKVISVLYMFISIGALGTTISVANSKANEFFSKKRKGLVTMKEKVDLLIIGYPNEAKVKKIVREFRLDKRFAHAAIVIVVDTLEERPEWMATEDVYFVKGLASKKEVLERANVRSADRILVLANDPFDEASDEFSSSAIIMCERLNPTAYSVAEKVRDDGYLFEVAECDLVVSVSRAGELVQELQDPGAIELSESIFSNSVEGNQYNMILPKEAPWHEIVGELLDAGGTAIGYRNPSESKFCFVPRKNDTIKAGALVKYIALKPFSLGV